LMALLTADVIANDPQTAVIVIDPHRTLAQRVCSLIPPEQQKRAIYWSLSDRERPFGLNLLDRMPRADGTPNDLHIDKRVSDIIDAFREIWPDNWGPRMEDYLRGPLLTLASANESLISDWRFQAWRRETTLALQANHAQIAQGRLDVQATAMILDTQRAFRNLTMPGRPSSARLWKACAEIYNRLESAPGGAPPDLALAAAARDLLMALAVDQSPDISRHSTRGDRLASRLFEDPADGLARPLQFTLLDVNALLLSRQMQTDVKGALTEDNHWHIRDWWENSYDAYYALNPRLLLDMITPVVTKMNRFKSSDVARRIFGQPESTIDLKEVMDEGKILLIDLAAGVVGQETAALIGSTILNWLASLIFARQSADPAAGGLRRVLVVVDEFQSIPGADYTFMLSELAKYGAQLCMGTQSLRFLDQVSKKTRAAWLDNTSALFVFRCGAEDARELSRELAVSEDDVLSVTPSDIVGLPDYACFARIRDERRQPVVFRVDTRKVEDGDPAIFAAIREASRQRYGRCAAQVDYWLRQAASFHGPADVIDEEPRAGAGQNGRSRAQRLPAPLNANGASDKAVLGDSSESDEAQEIDVH
ncbi:MAG: TraM recognition domain-containing protein, partial [Aggregatilineales bacterium]